VEDLLGDSSRARTQLGWQPTITFREMIREMVNDDISGYLENECKNTRA